MRTLVVALLALLPLVSSAQVSFGSATLVNDGWKFSLSDNPAAKDARFDDHTWQQVDLPHDWSVKSKPSEKLASATGYLPGGIGWYRKTLTIPAVEGGEKVFLYFEGVYNHSEVYFNGTLLGKRPNGFVSFLYDATPYVRLGEENTLAVRVDHSRSADSRWYTGSGINRNVYLVRANPVHFARWGVFVQPELQGAAARVRVGTELQNETAIAAELTLVHELVGADGKVAATTRTKVSSPAKSSASAEAVLDVREPHLWSVEAPYLYEVRTTLLQGDRVLDKTSSRTGLRTFAFDADSGFSLNGRPTKMKGVCLHDDAGVLGTAVPRVVWKQRLETLKSIGCNAVRMSHNPHAPDVYDLCDELGILVLDEAFDEWEFPKRKWISGWNVGTPGLEGSAEFFEEWSDRDVADMVLRDRNHPSIFAWSIGNEVDYPNDPYSHPVLDNARINQPTLPGYKPGNPDARRLGAIAKRLVADVKKFDRTRPLTAALAGVVMSNETEYPAALDIVGYNYTEDRYAMDHAKYPERVLYGSENGHLYSAWRAVVDHNYVFGQFLWTGIDYLGEAGRWPSRGSSAGLLDLTGAIKPNGRFREALWSTKPVIAIGTETKPREDRKSTNAWPVWNYAEGAVVRVLGYTNAARARLLLNEKPIGEEKPYDNETGVIAWDIPFAPGKLEAVALDADGRETARAAIQTVGAPAALRAAAAENTIDRRRGVSIIAVQIVDQDGVPVLNADPEITCKIDGPARLLGLEAGNTRDVSDTSDAEHKAFHGRLVAYVEATGTEGAVRVTFTAAGLPDASVTITAR